MKISLGPLLVQRLQCPSLSKLEQYRSLAEIHRQFKQSGSNDPLGLKISRELRQLSYPNYNRVDPSLVLSLERIWSAKDKRIRKTSPRLPIIGGSDVPNPAHPLFRPDQSGSGVSMQALDSLVDSLQIRDAEFPPPKHFTVSPELMSSSCSLNLFGHEVGLREIFNVFRVPIPGYCLQGLDLKRKGQGGLGIHGTIATDSGESAGEFDRYIPPRPEKGKMWVAEGGSFNAHLVQHYYGDEHVKKGIGRAHHQRLLAFFRRLGIDAMSLHATYDGLYVWPHIGFDFPGTEARDALKVSFRDYLRRHGKNLSLREEVRWAAISHAWNIVDFTREDGARIGREFLLHYLDSEGFHWPYRFWLKPDYPGWKRLFKIS